ncbi:MAG: SpoIVB peptidase S55 domain-containing protein [Thermoanaerobaculia bacterium]
MRKTTSYCIRFLALTVLAAPSVAEEQEQRPHFDAGEALPTISASELMRGQKGYGLSVFSGTEPERFEVEVLGVMRNSRPEMSYILARLTGQDLERSGVAAGMSGSPVYIDGRLAGAVAFSWLFGLDAIAGITPIDAMRRLSDLPEAELPQASPRSFGAAAQASGLKVSFEDLVKREFSADQLESELQRLAWAPPGAAGATTALHWTASGFGAAAFGLLERAFGGLTGSGLPGSGLPAAGAPAPATAAAGMLAGGQSEAGGDLVPGSAVAALMVQGDLSLAGHGTVTDRHGDEILAFGHPMFALGPVDLPLASSEVVTVISSAFNSFKLSNAGAVIGAFDQDRQAGVRGRLGRTASTTPLRVELDGLAQHEYHMRVANIPQMRPLLIAISALGALDSGSYSGGSQGLDLVAEFDLPDYEKLIVRQSFDGDQAGMQSILYLLNFALYLENTTLAQVEIAAVDVELDQVDRPRSATLVAAHPERRRVEPGATVPVTLELQPFRGERYREKFEVEIPEHAADGRYVVILGDGTSMDAVRLAVERPAPQTIEQVLSFLGSLHSRRQLQAFGLVSGNGLALAGEALPDLPSSVRSVFNAAATAVRVPLTLTIVHEQLTSLERPIDGVARIDFQVERNVARDF